MWVLALLAAGFGLGALLGAPYLPILSRDVDSILDLADLSVGETLLDLGCGDGKLLVAAAKRGIKGEGYEVNPWLFLVAKFHTFPYRGMVNVRLGNYWATTWPQADVIYIFGIKRIMPKFDQELNRRLNRPTKVVSYIFELPAPTVRSTKNARLYSYPVLLK